MTLPRQDGAPSLEVPASFVAKNRGARGEAGAAWAARLPEIVAACAERWALALEPAYGGLSYNWAAPARRADGTPSVLKLCFPDPEYATEAAALRLFDGRAAVRLLAVDEALGALLLERLLPGGPLGGVADDRAATSAAASVMRGLWRPAPAVHPFPTIGDWLTRAAGRVAAARRAGGGEPPAWAGRVLALHRELAHDRPPRVVLHGDLHQWNVLAATRAPWLAIDPKGAVGEPAEEIGAWLVDRVHRAPTDAEARQRLLAMCDQLAEELGLDRARARAAALVRAAISALWSLESGWSGSASSNRCVALLEAAQL